MQLPPILPEGTAVVTRVPLGSRENPRPPGLVGRLVRCPLDPTHGYRVTLVTGEEITLTRDQFSELTDFHSPGHAPGTAAIDPMDEHSLHPYVIYKCVIGSRAYGLDTDASDTDHRGVYLPPADLHWSLAGVPEQLENHATQEVYWEMGKFIQLALKANPGAYETLYSPVVELCAPLAENLLAQRDCFLSKLAYQTYVGYTQSQFRKMEQDMRSHGEIRWKHAMHLIRLLMLGIGILKDRTVQLNASAHRGDLLAIKRQEVPWAEVDKLRLSLQREFEMEFARTTLPERPDYAKANVLLIEARRAMV
jgi:uncharacterized protein